MGQAYVGGTDSLVILSFFFALTAFGSVLSPMLVALSETRMVMWITVASVLMAVASAYMLLPFFGITGASIARRTRHGRVTRSNDRCLEAEERGKH